VTDGFKVSAAHCAEPGNDVPECCQIKNDQISAGISAGGGEMGGLDRAGRMTVLFFFSRKARWGRLRAFGRQSLRNRAADYAQYQPTRCHLVGGDDLINFYNDAYRQTMGPEPPSVRGSDPSAAANAGLKSGDIIRPPDRAGDARRRCGPGHGKPAVPGDTSGRLGAGLLGPNGYRPIDEGRRRRAGVLVFAAKWGPRMFDATRAAREERGSELARVQQIGPDRRA